MNRYSAKLLFQFRVVVNDHSGRRRLCEERIVLLNARTSPSALKKADRRGKAAEYTYKNDDGNTVYFEYIGILELLLLGNECEQDEVWYDIRERVLPMENRDQLIPPKSELSAFRNARPIRG